MEPGIVYFAHPNQALGCQALDRRSRRLSRDSGAGCAFAASVFSPHGSQRRRSMPIALLRNGCPYSPRRTVARALAPVLDAHRIRNGSLVLLPIVLDLLRSLAAHR